MNKCLHECPLRDECIDTISQDNYALRQAQATTKYLAEHPGADPDRRRTKKHIGKAALSEDPMGTLDDMLNDHGTEYDDTVDCPGPKKERRFGLVQGVTCRSVERQTRVTDMLASEVEASRRQVGDALET